MAGSRRYALIQVVETPDDCEGEHHATQHCEVGKLPKMGEGWGEFAKSILNFHINNCKWT